MKNPVRAAEQSPDGWRLRLEGTLISYCYVGVTDFAFEIWQGGEVDVTVRLLRPFTFGIGGPASAYDPRSSRRSELAPLLDLGSHRVDEVFIARAGKLAMTFSDGSRLSSPPAVDGCAWRLKWPSEGDVIAEACPGAGVAFPEPGARRAPDDEPGQPAGDPASLAPVHRGALTKLPISGVITMSPVSGSSIELMMGPDAGDEFCIHFGGLLEITGPAGDTWHGRGDSDTPSTLGRVLDLVGNCVTEAHMDEKERLHLALADGTRAMAATDGWEAHWHVPDQLDDYWVPRGGPRIP